MNLKDIFETESDRVNLLKGIIRVARIDGELEEEEEQYFRGFMAALTITPTHAAELEKALKAPMVPVKDREMLKIQFSNKKQSILFLEEIIQLACIDGVYQDKERAEVKTIAQELAISKEPLTKVEEWVDEGMAWQARGEGLLNLE